MEPVSLHRRVDLDVSVDELWELIAHPTHLRWEARVCLLWARTVVAALVP